MSIKTGTADIAGMYVGANAVKAVYQGDELLWSGRESMRFTLTMTEETTISTAISTRFVLATDVPSQEAFPITVYWGDGTETVYPGELDTMTSSSSTRSRYRAEISHTYAAGTYDVLVTKENSEALNWGVLKNSAGSKENVVVIDARDGTWGQLPYMGDIPSTAARFTTLHLGNNAAGSTGFYNCPVLETVTMGPQASLGVYTLAGNPALEYVEILAASVDIGAFKDDSNLKKAWIRNTVTYMDSDVFEGCDLLTVYCEADEQPAGWGQDWNDYGCPVVWGQKTRPW